MSRLSTELENKSYRDGYVASQIWSQVPLQIRAMRLSRQMDQKQFAKVVGMTQPRISEIERNYRNSTIPTLLRIANALDVGLYVGFVSIGALVRQRERFDPDAFNVNSWPAPPSPKLGADDE